jgi:hypothetical protein
MMIFISLELLRVILLVFILINSFLRRSLVQFFWLWRSSLVVMILSQIFLCLFLKWVRKKKLIEVLSLGNQPRNLVSVLLFLGCLIVNLILDFGYLLIDVCENLWILFILFSMDIDRYHILINTSKLSKMILGIIHLWARSRAEQSIFITNYNAVLWLIMII